MTQMLDKGVPVIILERSNIRFSGQQHAPGAINHRERTGIHIRGDCVDVRAGLEWRKVCPHWNSFPDCPRRGSSVALPTELHRPTPIANIPI